jgi:hypothetical protein
MAIDSKHPQYKYREDQINRCRDCYEGEDRIKNIGEKYLPRLSGQDATQYNAYKARGTFYGAVDRTLNVLLGLMFHKPPTIKVPAKLEPYLEDITDTGVPINKFINAAALNVLLTGRYGIMVDRDQGGERPYFVGYETENIPNWITQDNFLTNLVLDISEYVSGEDIYDQVLEHKFLEVYTDENGVHSVEHVYDSATKTYKKMDNTLLDFVKRGQKIEEIPFTFITPLGLESDQGKPPFLDLVNAVIGHWKNSVDLEHGRHWTAIPTPWISGITDPDAIFSIGGEIAWLLPENGQAGFLEFTGSGLAALESAIEHKEKLIAILGSRMMEGQKNTAESSESKKLNKIGDNSILSMVASSVEAGIKDALQKMAVLEGLNSDEVEVEFNKEYSEVELNPQLITALLQAYQTEALSLDSFIYNLKKGQLIPEDRTVEDELNLIGISSPALSDTGTAAIDNGLSDGGAQ